MSTDDDDENDAGRQTSKSTRLLQVFFTGGRGGGRGRGEGRRRESSGNLEKGEKGGEGGEREKLATLIDARTAASLAIAQKKRSGNTLESDNVTLLFQTFPALPSLTVRAELSRSNVPICR